jgi:hypothetical protein
MGTLAEYFEKNRYKAKYQFGERVIGKWHKIPFVGTIYSDNVVNEMDGPRLSIHLDLPLKYKNKTYNILTVLHKEVTIASYK